ncbi:MAG: L-rhamnose mutarotase [Cyclobacteriaceae bacterium]
MQLTNSLIVLFLEVFIISCNLKDNGETELRQSGTKETKLLIHESWDHPLTKMERLKSLSTEPKPFIFNNDFYLLENWRSSYLPGPRKGVKKKEIWIAHLPNGPEDYEGRTFISTPLKENSLGTAIVWEGRVYVFGVNETKNRKYVEMTRSENLKTWSEPVKVFDSPAGKIFNVSLTRDDKGFVFLWETDCLGKPFTMCFGRISSLTDNWNDHIIKDANYGDHKYTGGPEVVYANGWYYLLYLESLEVGWETRITRSRDLIQWQDAPEDRPFLTHNVNNKNLPYSEPEVHEINASDPGLTVYNGKVIVYFTGGIQQEGADLQWAIFNGTIHELMESYFLESFKKKPLRYGMVTGIKPEKIAYYKELHANTWEGVLKKIKEANIENYSIYIQKIEDKYYLFSYYEYVGNNYEEDMKKIAADTTTQRWWKETDPCQIPLPEASSKNEIWTTMEEVFHTD